MKIEKREKKNIIKRLVHYSHLLDRHAAVHAAIIIIAAQ